jgi:hypothetical protein
MKFLTRSDIKHVILKYGHKAIELTPYSINSTYYACDCTFLELIHIQVTVYSSTLLVLRNCNVTAILTWYMAAHSLASDVLSLVNHMKHDCWNLPIEGSLFFNGHNTPQTGFLSILVSSLKLKPPRLLLLPILSTICSEAQREVCVQNDKCTVSHVTMVRKWDAAYGYCSYRTSEYRAW